MILNVPEDKEEIATTISKTVEYDPKTDTTRVLEENGVQYFDSDEQITIHGIDSVNLWNQNNADSKRR